MEMIQAKETDIEDIVTFYKSIVTFQIKNNQKQWDYQDVTWDALTQLYGLSDIYLMKIGHKIIAACFIVDEDPIYWPNIKKHDSLFLHKLAVDPSYRKQHVGDQVLSFFQSLGKIQGVKDVRLDVRAHKTQLRAFYERNGFQLVEIASIFETYDTALYRYQWEEPYA